MTLTPNKCLSIKLTLGYFKLLGVPFNKQAFADRNLKTVNPEADEQYYTPDFNYVSAFKWWLRFKYHNFGVSRGTPTLHIIGSDLSIVTLGWLEEHLLYISFEYKAWGVILFGAHSSPVTLRTFLLLVPSSQGKWMKETAGVGDVLSGCVLSDMGTAKSRTNASAHGSGKAFHCGSQRDYKAFLGSKCDCW